jgi:plasmid stabilization system protein ParE
VKVKAVIPREHADRIDVWRVLHEQRDIPVTMRSSSER